MRKYAIKITEDAIKIISKRIKTHTKLWFTQLLKKRSVFPCYAFGIGFWNEFYLSINHGPIVTTRPSPTSSESISFNHWILAVSQAYQRWSSIYDSFRVWSPSSLRLDNMGHYELSCKSKRLWNSICQNGFEGMTKETKSNSAS